MRKTFVTKSPDETRVVAATLARELLSLYESSTDALLRNHAHIVALEGDLGAGKTTFAQGFLSACGAHGPFTSPTFGIIKQYDCGQNASLTHVYHVDPYRIGADDLLALGWEEMCADPRALLIVEWPTIIASIMPQPTLHVTLTYGEDMTTRTIVVTWYHKKGNS